MSLRRDMIESSFPRRTRTSMQKIILPGAIVAIACLAYAQRGGPSSWAPKPVELTKYVAPHKPHTKLADLKAKYSGKKEWRQVIVDDEHLHGEYIYSPPGAKVFPRFHP